MRPRPALSSLSALVFAVCATAGRAAPAPDSPLARTPVAAPEKRLTLTSKKPERAHGRWFAAFEEQTFAPGGADKALGPSSRGAADVDCAAAQFRIARFSAFVGPNFTGAVLVELGQRSEWRSPEPGTTMDRVLAAICGPAKAPARARAPAAADPPAPHPGPPSPPTSAPAEAVQTPDQTPAQTQAGAAFYAQLASLPSEDAARQTWAAFERAAPGLLDEHLSRLTVATVNGRRVYRVLAGGFGTKAQAERVCRALARLSTRCFVRPDGAA